MKVAMAFRDSAFFWGVVVVVVMVAEMHNLIMMIPMMMVVLQLSASSAVAQWMRMQRQLNSMRRRRPHLFRFLLVEVATN